MSCFVHITTQLRDLDTVRQAAEELGYVVRTGATEVRGYNENTAPAKLVMALTASYDVGVTVGDDGACGLIADWEMSRVDKTAFANALSQRYSLIQVKEKARRAGFVIAKEQKRKDGTVSLVLRRFE